MRKYNIGYFMFYAVITTKMLLLTETGSTEILN